MQAHPERMVCPQHFDEWSGDAHGKHGRGFAADTDHFHVRNHLQLGQQPVQRCIRQGKRISPGKQYVAYGRGGGDILDAPSPLVAADGGIVRASGQA